MSATMSATAVATAAYEIAWRFLRNCPIESNLEEIDAHWVLLTLQDSGEPDVEEISFNLCQQDLNLLAYDLKDIWHEAICEAMQWDNWDRYDYD